MLVIGGGVNGAAVARDLAGRGLSVVLCEKDDLAAATSSASTKLIHGGLRYLEYYEFRLVRESLKEREVLLHAAPHIIWPLSFVLPHHKALRPWWLIRLGLFIYDHLGGRKSLPSSRGEVLTGTFMGEPLKRDYRRGFIYSDCWVEDSRLVVLNALDAAEKGADILTRALCTDLYKHSDQERWVATIELAATRETLKVQAKMVVNAAGPWVNDVARLVAPDAPAHKIRWVKGSHIIVPRLYQGEHAYILQSGDKRIVFAIPYEKKYTLIGTTEEDYTGDLDQASISEAEVNYLCTTVSEYFRHSVTPDDIEWTYSGIRPLLDDGAAEARAVTRDYVLAMQEHKNLPILSVYGGKITTARRLAEQAADMVVEKLGKGKKKWTAEAPLPGGEEAGATVATFIKTLKREYNWMPEPLLLRYARAYGTRLRNILRGCKKISDLGTHFGDQVYECEVKYLIDTEWARTAEDILWRRSKLGLHTSAETQARIDDYVRGYVSARL